MKKQNPTSQKQTLPVNLPTLPAEPPENIPSYAVPREQANMVLDLPNTITAHSLSTLSAHLDPDHPAADLQRLNHKLLNILMEEGEQMRLLRRQTQTMDAMFHVLVKHGFTASLPPDAATRATQQADYDAALKKAPAPNPLLPAILQKKPQKPEAPKLTTAERELIALSLQAQRQCTDTICGLGKLNYLERMMNYVESRPADMHPTRR